MATVQKQKPACQYGGNCYRKNPQHRKDYSHPEDDRSDEEEEPAAKRHKGESDPELKDEESDKEIASEPEIENEQTEEKKKNVGNASGYVRAEEESKITEREDDESGPESPVDIKLNIKNKFLVEMPEDFYDFWEFAKTVNKKTPADAFLSSLGLQLVGPFDVLAKKTKAKNSQGKKPCYLRHWRYYYDPPEFLTVVKGDDSSQFHMGYFRDSPNELPVFVASNAAKDNCNLAQRGENLFAAFKWFIEDKLKQTKSKELQKLKEEIENYAKSKSFPLELKTAAMKKRDKKVVCKGFHGAGIVVPVDANEIGYRPVPETPGDMRKMFKKIVDSKTEEEKNKHFDPLMEIIMFVQFANDECDYGMGLELGLDLFCYGGYVFKKTILNLMPLAYELLGRMEFKQIIEAHLEDRKHSASLNQLD